MKNLIVYDVEVLRGPSEVPGEWQNPEKMGFASAVAYVYATDQYHFFLHSDSRRNLCSLLHDQRGISFNGVKFDSRVLLGNDREFNLLENTVGNREVAFWSEYDILLEYIRTRFALPDVAAAEAKLGDKTIHDGSFSLDGLAEGTLSLNKTGHGAKAPELYRQGKYAELLAYNLNDVRLTRKLFDFVMKYGFLVDRKGRVVYLAKVKERLSL